MDSKTEQPVKKVLVPKFYRILWVLLLIIFIGDFIYVMKAPQPFSEQNMLLFVGVLSLTVFVGFISFVVWLFTKASKRIKKLLVLIPLPFIGIYLILGFLISTITVAGSSMPTYKDGSTQIICKACKDIKRGDVVVYNSVEKPFSRWVIARVVGTPGESITLVKGKLTVNGKAVDESYADWSEWKQADRIDITLGENEFLALLDKRKIEINQDEFTKTFKFNTSSYIGKIL